MHSDIYSEIYYNFTKKQYVHIIILHTKRQWERQYRSPYPHISGMRFSQPNPSDKNQLAISEMNLILTRRMSSSE